MNSTATPIDATQQKGLLAKTRDYIHQKVATDDQLLNEKPFSEQVKAKIPASTEEVAEKFDASLASVKQKFNERLDEGTDRTPKHVQKQQEQQPGAIRTKLYEATKSPEVKKLEEFRQKPIMEKLGEMSSGDVNVNASEIFA